MTVRPPQIERRLAWLLPLAVILLAAGVTVAVATVRLATRGPLRVDEPIHALKGLVMAHALAQGDWLGFAFDSYRQVLYPPLHSWALAVVYLLFGPTLIAAAGVSLAAYLAGGLLFLWAGKPLNQGRANLTGAAAALFWFTNPALQGFAIQVMLEIPGLAALLCALALALKLLADDMASDPPSAPAPRRWVWLGVGLLLTYFTRTPYGIVLALALGLTLLARAGWQPQRLWRAEMGWLLLAPLLAFGIWFAYTPKIAATWRWLLGAPDGMRDPYSVAGWLFAPQALVEVSGGPWLLGFYLLALLWAWTRRRSTGLTLLTALLLVQFSLALAHQNKQARFLFPMLPALFLVGGMAVDDLWQWARRRRGWAWLAAGAVTAALVGQSGLMMAAALRPGPGEQPDPVTETILQQLDAAPATLILGSWEMGYPGPALLDWKLIAAGRLAAPQAGGAAQIEEGRQLAQAMDRLPLPAGFRARLTATFTAYDAPAPLRTLYVGIPQRASYAEGGRAYARFLHDLLARHSIAQVIVVNRANARRYPTAELLAPLPAAGYTLAVEQRFHETGMTVLVYRLE